MTRYHNSHKSLYYKITPTITAPQHRTVSNRIEWYPLCEYFCHGIVGRSCKGHLPGSIQFQTSRGVRKPCENWSRKPSPVSTLSSSDSWHCDFPNVFEGVMMCHAMEGKQDKSFALAQVEAPTISLPIAASPKAKGNSARCVEAAVDWPTVVVPIFRNTSFESSESRDKTWLPLEVQHQFAMTAVTFCWMQLCTKSSSRKVADGCF